MQTWIWPRPSLQQVLLWCPGPLGPDPLDDQINLAQIWTRSSSRSGPPCSNLARSTERPGPLSHRRSVPCLGPYPLLARAQSVQVLSSNFGAQVYLIKFSDSSCGTRSTLRPDPLWDRGHLAPSQLVRRVHPSIYIYIYTYIYMYIYIYIHMYSTSVPFLMPLSVHIPIYNIRCILHYNLHLTP